MHAVQVVRRAQADAVPRLVAASVRFEIDVMRMIRRQAATRHPAEPVVALQDLARGRHAALHHGFPDVEEVRGDAFEALSVGNPPSRGLSRRSERHRDEPRDRPGRPDLEFAPRAQLRFFDPLQLAPQVDASHRFGALDPGVDRLPVHVPRDEPRLFVGDAPLAHRLPERGQLVQFPLERGALLDGPHRHVEPLRPSDPRPRRRSGTSSDRTWPMRQAARSTSCGSSTARRPRRRGRSAPRTASRC